MATESKMEFHDDSYDLVAVDEFDALSIELKPGSSSTPSTERAATSKVSEDPNGMIYNRRLNQKWLEGLGKFPAKTHARKVANELGAKQGLIYLPGQDEKYYEDSDMGPTFRQRRYFYYMAGADFQGCAVTYDIRKDHLVLWVPRIDPKTVLWFGGVPTPEECKAASDVDDVRYIETLSETLCPALEPGETIYVLHRDQIPKLDHLMVVVRVDTTHLRLAMDAARVIKTDHEIALIRRANAISSAAHKAVLHSIKRFTNEREVDSLFTGYCTAHGAPIQAYPVIAASGANASTLHYADNNQPFKNRQLLILDAGAEYHCYASDVTRTIPLRTFSRNAGAIYRLVERMQAECIAQIRPGVRYRALHAHACAVAVAGLLRLGVLRGGSEGEILGRGTVAAFFPHGLGHHVGLEVHDVSGRERLLLGGAAAAGGAGARGGRVGGRMGMRMKREGMTPGVVAALWADENRPEGAMAASLGGPGQKLAEGMVVTVEPGIYFCREYIEGYFLNDPDHAKYIDAEVLAKYWDVGGVRIEDDILVTKDGYENLTWAPKGDEMLKCMNEPTPL
ncbi:putative Xaa-Pro aminopeptidase [Chaetomium fimeti]|uniref:Xaa-Pro aminopeptidase n=1 Tax=Chaetomium fimeti TaxID=1854472 RepID=A0AAE0HG99_9PEZI|nr:putative Xaa-Pro aminopeptidase [Chaetomium fimeti]